MLFIVTSDMKGLKIHRDIGIDIVIPYVAPMFQGHKDILLRHRYKSLIVQSDNTLIPL
jgi:hypothetical protein